MPLRISAAVVGVLATLAASASGEKKLVTVDDLMGLRTVNDVRISPDGRHVAYTVSTPSYDTDSHETVLYVVATASAAGSPDNMPTRLAEATPILNRPLPNPALRWSPDGRTISFLSPVQGMPQVMGIDMNGGVARTLTSAKGGVIAYEWSPDGRELAYVASDPPSDEETRQRREKTFVIQVDRQDRPVRLWRQAIEGGAPQSLTPPEQFVSGLSWSPDGAAIAYSASLTTGFMATYNSRIYTVPAAGGTPRAVVERPGMNVGPKFSPDGRWIAFTSTDGRAAMISTWGLHTARADGGEIRNLSAKNETWAGDYLWLPDAQSLLLLPEEGTVRRGARMFDRPVVRVSAAGDSEVLTAPEIVAYSPSLSADGRLLAYRAVEPRTMGDVVVMDVATRRVTRLTTINPQLEALALGEIRAVGWKSFDGMEIWGLLLTPPGYRPGTRVPLVVYAHGGPIGGFTHGIFPQFMHRIGQVDLYPTDAMASAGMAVLFPMPRGGAGYGEAGFRMIVKRWGEDDYKDIMAGVDHVIALGIADPGKLGVMGASYGGFMTSWIVTQTNRFKAASTGASVVDLAALYYQSDAGEVTKEYFGLPWENRDLYAQHSPLTHAANVKTPLLIQHGENDRRVPVSQATSFYRALKAHGAQVELDIYPGGSHVLYEPDLERVQMQRNLDWFKKWLSPAPAQITR
jgi:dipeptidyl aminopeptidase/acylaminoacyl peptidase